TKERSAPPPAPAVWSAARPAASREPRRRAVVRMARPLGGVAMRRKVAVFAVAFTLALAFAIASVAVAGGCEARAGTSEGTGLAVSVKGCAFGPTILHTPVGATVNWKNDDFLPHAINGGGWTATPGGVQANPGMTVSYKFDTAGIY